MGWVFLLPQSCTNMFALSTETKNVDSIMVGGILDMLSTI